MSREPQTNAAGAAVSTFDFLMTPYSTLGAAAILAAALSLSPGPRNAGTPVAPPVAAPAANGRLAVWDGAQWRPWWDATSAPPRWSAPHPVVSGAVQWRTAQPGLDVGVLRFAGQREAWRFNVALLRVDPEQYEFALHVKRSAEGRALPWSIDDVPDDAALAINAGMFDVVGPWGWIVLDGAERQAPGRGPLSAALTVDAAGAVRIVGADSIAALRSRGVRWAVQSYPVALEGDGEIPAPIRLSGRGVNLTHRDARLAVATLRDGRVMIALTRFDGLAGALDEIPFGPTLPEMTAILGALGAQRAVFLDGGTSAQMAVRDASGAVQRWEGMRNVPLALVARRAVSREP